MQLDKQTIINELKSRGETEMVSQAERSLPSQVHLGDHAVELKSLGLDPQDLANRFLGSNAPPPSSEQSV